MTDRATGRLIAHAERASSRPVAVSRSPIATSITGAFEAKDDPHAIASVLGGPTMTALLADVELGDPQQLGDGHWRPLRTAGGVPVYGAGMLTIGGPAVRGATIVRPEAKLPKKPPRGLSPDAAIEFVRRMRVLEGDFDKPETLVPELVWFDPQLFRRVLLDAVTAPQWAWRFAFAGDRPADVVVDVDGKRPLIVVTVDPERDIPFQLSFAPSYILDDVTGVPRFVSFLPHLLLPVASSRDPLAVAQQFFRTFPRMFGTADPAAQLVVQRVEKDLDGGYHVHFGQRHAGLAVWGCRLSVHLTPSCAITSVSGRWMRDPEVDLTPIVTEQAAFARAAGDAAEGRHDDKEKATSVPVSRGLVILPWRLADPGGENHLAWQFGLADEERFVSAHTGAIVARVSNRHATRFVYDANQARSGGTLDLEDGVQRSARLDRESLPADAAIAATEALWTLFGRDGWNHRGDNSVLRLDMNLDDPTTVGVEVNAYWSPFLLEVNASRGFAEPDVVAHEFTHALTQGTAGLVYAAESGALNESFSDVFGKLIVPTPQPWIMGVGAGVTRDLVNPGVDRYSAYVASPVDEDNDYGGVHTNSGIGNRAAVLIADGDATHTGLGRERLIRIWWDTLTTRLGPWSTYVDLAANAWQVTNELFEGGRSGVALPGGMRTPPPFEHTDPWHVLWAFREVELDLALQSGWFHVAGRERTDFVFREGVQVGANELVSDATLRVSSWRQHAGTTAFLGVIDVPTTPASSSFHNGTVTASITRHGIGTRSAEVRATVTSTNMAEFAVASEVRVVAAPVPPGTPPPPPAPPTLPFTTPRVVHWWDNAFFAGRSYGDIVYENATLPAGFTVADVVLELLDKNNVVVARHRLGEPGAASTGFGAYIRQRTLGTTALEVRVRSWHDFGWATRYRLVYWITGAGALTLPAFTVRGVDPATI